MSTMPDLGDPSVARDQDSTLLAFMDAMRAKLDANAHKGGWQADSPTALLRRLRDETVELQLAIEKYLALSHSLMNEKQDRTQRVLLEREMIRAGKHVASESADVANFAMFIADVTGGLEK